MSMRGRKVGDTLRRKRLPIHLLKVRLSFPSLAHSSLLAHSLILHRRSERKRLPGRRSGAGDAERCARTIRKRAHASARKRRGRRSRTGRSSRAEKDFPLPARDAVISLHSSQQFFSESTIVSPFFSFFFLYILRGTPSLSSSYAIENTLYKLLAYISFLKVSCNLKVKHFTPSVFPSRMRSEFEVR